MKGWFFEKDKLLHFIVGMIMAQVFFVAFDNIFRFDPYLSSFTASAVIMIGKELFWDKTLKNGVCSFRDVVSGLAGITLGMLLVVAMTLY